MKTPNNAYRFVSNLFLAGIVAFSNMVWATPDTTEQDYFSGEMPIVLSASRLKQNAAAAPVAITIIDRQMIEASGFTEIPDLLRLVPGFFVEYDSGHIQAAGYHLLVDRYVRQQQILIDGRSVYTPILGGIPWTELPITIDDIDRIEVIRGPNAATYGSNSFLGVINIITRQAVLDRGSSFKVNAGSHHLRETFVRYGDSAGSLDYRIGLAYRADDGFDNRHDGKIVRLINTRLDYQINLQSDISFQAGYSEGPRQEDNAFDPAISDHEKSTASQYQQIRWHTNLSTTDELVLQYYRNRLGENKTYYEGTRHVDEGSDSHRREFEIHYSSKYSDTLRFAAGASHRVDEVRSQLYYATPEDLAARFRRLFGEIEYQFSNEFILNTGLMLEDNDLTGTEHSPRITLNYRPTPHESLRATVSKATRTPTLAEEYPDYRILEPTYDQVFFDYGEIRSERVTSYELGYNANQPTHNLSYDLRLFYEQTRGIIGVNAALYPDATNFYALYFDNFDEILLRGAEFQVDWKPTQKNRMHFGFSHIEIDSVYSSSYVVPVPAYNTSAPANSFTFLGVHEFDDKLLGSLGIYHRTSMKPLARHSYDPETMPTHTRVDMRVAKSFTTARVRHTVALVGQNIFNSSYFTTLNTVIDQRGYVSYKIEF